MTREDQIQEMSRLIDTFRTALSTTNETLKYMLEDRRVLKNELEETRAELHQIRTSQRPPAPSTSPPPCRSRLTPPETPREFEDGFDVDLS